MVSWFPIRTPPKAFGLWTGFALCRSAATAPYPCAKRGSESLTRQAFFFPYLIFPAGDRRRPTDLCAFFTWCAGVVWAVFRFRIVKSSVFSRRRKTPEECSRSGRHDPYRFARILHMAARGRQKRRIAGAMRLFDSILWVIRPCGGWRCRPQPWR